MKVLVVDDSAVQRHKIVSYMCGTNPPLDILQAKDGAEALEMLNAVKDVDLLITDWNMPRMDGLSLVKAVRADRKFDKLKICMATTENDPWSVTRAIRAGADEYLMKPFDQECLIEKLRSIYGSHHAIFGCFSQV